MNTKRLTLLLIPGLSQALLSLLENIRQGLSWALGPERPHDAEQQLSLSGNKTRIWSFFQHWLRIKVGDLSKVFEGVINQGVRVVSH